MGYVDPPCFIPPVVDGDELAEVNALEYFGLLVTAVISTSKEFTLEIMPTLDQFLTPNRGQCCTNPTMCYTVIRPVLRNDHCTWIIRQMDARVVGVFERKMLRTINRQVRKAEDV